MRTKVLISLCLFFMPLILIGCGGGEAPKEAPKDVKDIVASQGKMYENMKKAREKPVR